jgi:hypothetical protein
METTDAQPLRKFYLYSTPEFSRDFPGAEENLVWIQALRTARVISAAVVHKNRTMRKKSARLGISTESASGKQPQKILSAKNHSLS